MARRFLVGSRTDIRRAAAADHHRAGPDKCTPAADQPSPAPTSASAPATTAAGRHRFRADVQPALLDAIGTGAGPEAGYQRDPPADQRCATAAQTDGAQQSWRQ